MARKTMTNKLKPWYEVVKPREDLREGKPLDAAEFAVHLDQVRDGRAHEDYQNPERFFERTFLTKNLLSLAAEVARRLAGDKTGTSAVFNMATQFGGGKTHALTLLYHLAKSGAKAKNFAGVSKILEQARLQEIPQTAVAVFVGTEFDSLQGRGGNDGTPKRKTPWGEIAYQLAGAAGFAIVAEHEQQMVAPGGDVIRQLLPNDRPALILMDEILNYISRNRERKQSAQFYNFLHNLSEVARGSDRLVLVASIPASELEMTVEDQADYTRFKKMLDRLGKALVMAAESETAEIIRRRLFEWERDAINQEGLVLLSQEAKAACRYYTDWIAGHHEQIPNWFSDHAQEAFEATYPFHPMVLSVFERKWQELPRFQQTRGVLRLLALWVSHAYREGFKGAQKDALISLGSAPMQDSQFRAALLEQLGEPRLEGAITTDICGKKESHAIRLDMEAEKSLQKAQLHKKVATVIFFESNGGQSKNTASVPEIRLGVTEPDLDIGNIETAIEALTDACYYLGVERNHYRFSLKENLNKRFADRRASIKEEDMEKLIREEIPKVFPAAEGVERIFFPEKSSQIPDKPVVTLVIAGQDMAVQEEPRIAEKIETMTREYGTSARVYKSALIWIVLESAARMREEARKFMAWSDIHAEGLQLDAAQETQLNENIKKAKRDLKESVWHSYTHLYLLGKDNNMKQVDLGQVNSSMADNMCKLILNHLRQIDVVVKEFSPRALVKNWPPAFSEWSTKAVRDVFYASPQFPLLLQGDAVKETVARGVAEGAIAYVGKSAKGDYSTFLFKKTVAPAEIEISDDMFIISGAEAEKHIQPPQLTSLQISPVHIELHSGQQQTFGAKGYDQFGREMPIEPMVWEADGGEINPAGGYQAGEEDGEFLVKARSGQVSAQAKVVISKEQGTSGKTLVPPKPKQLSWSGEIPSQKWTNFYMKLLTKLVKDGQLELMVSLKATPSNGLTPQQIEETKAALRELGLNDDVQTSE